MGKDGATHCYFQSLVCISYQGIYLEHRLLHPALLSFPDFVVLGWGLSNKFPGGAEAACSTLRTLGPAVILDPS